MIINFLFYDRFVFQKKEAVISARNNNFLFYDRFVFQKSSSIT